MSQTNARKSYVSQHSESFSRFNDDADELTDAELVKQVTKLKQQVKKLKLENEIFEKTIMRLDPTMMHGVNQVMEYAAKLSRASTMGMASMSIKSTSKFGSGFGETLASPSKMFTSASKMSMSKSSGKLGGSMIFGVSTGPKINVLEKLELVSTEMAIVQASLEKVRAKAVKQNALLKAELEEVDLRDEDTEKSDVRFNKEVIVDGWDKIAQRIPAEVWIRYITEWLKISDSQIGKLRLRTSTSNSQYSKLKCQFKVKSELSESLRPIDFDKLTIDNNECLKLINRKLNQIQELKMLTGDAHLNLTIHKNALMEQNEYLDRIHNMIKKKERLVVKLDKESSIIRAQTEGLTVEFESIKKLRMAYEVPPIIEYVQMKSELGDLRRVVKVLENREHIQRATLTSLTKKLQSTCF